MKKLKILTQPTRVSTLEFDDVDYNDAWNERTARFQTQQMRRLRNKMA